MLPGHYLQWKDAASAVTKRVLGRGLVDPSGRVIKQPVSIWPVFRQPGARVFRADSVPGTPLIIPPAALSHIINRHSAAARTASLKRIAAGTSKLSDFQYVGYFYPEYSTPPAIIQLIQDVDADHDRRGRNKWAADKHCRIVHRFE